MRQPLLVLGRHDGPNRFAGYLREILATEGIATWEYRDLADDSVDLTGDDLLILENAPVPAEWRVRLEAYVRGGGRLIASRPPLELAGLFGLNPTPSVVRTCRDMYVTWDTTHPLAARPGAESLQFRGLADLYELAGAEGLAWLGGQLGVRTHYPAVTMHRVGEGMAAAFAFDLAACTVLMHQGTPVNASTGPNPDPNGDEAYKPGDLFYKYLDPRLKTVPQADLYADLLVRLVRHLGARPLPRLWHFPAAAPAVAFLDGDSDSMTTEDVEKVVEIAERADGKYTVYLMPEHYETVTPERMRELRDRGHDAGPHPFAGRKPSPDESAREMAEETAEFRARYGFQPVAHRGHNVIWLGWVEHARELRRNGIRLDTNFCCGPGLQYGYLNGSGLPVRFMDEAGEIIDVYEQATVSMEDGWYTEKVLMPSMSVGECTALSIRQIDEAADRWHAVYHPCFHPTYTRPGPRDSSPWIEAVTAHLRARGIPFVNGGEWVGFNDARRTVRFDGLAWKAAEGDLRFTLHADRTIAGLTVLLPAQVGGREARPAGDGPDMEQRFVVLEHTRQLAVVVDLTAHRPMPVRIVYDIATEE